MQRASTCTSSHHGISITQGGRPSSNRATTSEMASLLSIPLEMLVEISASLTTTDLGALRLTCKQIEKSLFEWFSQEFFTKKQFMLTHKSLQAFVDISRHVSFSKKLTHVIIATNIYRDTNTSFKDSDAAASYTQGCEDQKALLNTGIDREMLTAAFQNLENLHTVGIRDFNSNGRSRDGIDWSSWGATTVLRETGVELKFAGVSPYDPPIAQDYLARVFQSLIYALGRADQTPEEIELLLRRHSLPDHALNLPNFLLPAVKPLLHNLKKLLLNADALYVHKYNQVDGNLLEQGPGRALLRFLAQTPNLEHFRLNLVKGQVEANEQLLQRLSTSASTVGSQTGSNFFDPPPIKLEYLASLELGQVQVKSKIVLDLIAKFAPTLRQLTLWKMALRDAQPTAHDPKPNLWAGFFKNMAKIPGLELHHLKAGMLGQGFNFVQFRSSGSKDASGVKVKEYTGTKMGPFMKELKEDVFVLWKPAMVVDTSDNSDEDEEMADDDDDGADDNEDANDEDDDEDESGYED
jgi:hypothetical protein